jgi:hypothetical protein
MPSPRRSPGSLLAICLAACFGLMSCSPDLSSVEYPATDLHPPDLLAAGPTSSRQVLLRFDETVTPVTDSYAVEPEAKLSCRVDGESLALDFGQAQSAGADYSLVGEVDDLSGNRTRFLVRFTGWNDRAPPLLLSEVLPCKNGSRTKPHRDFVELKALEDGNLGGEELSWTSSVKTESYRFPSVEVRKGDFVVLHLAPEGLPEERDELGADISSSGGVDATATGRDLWCGSMALPEASGAIALALRPGSPPMDGFFYADDGKSGALGDGRLADFLTALSDSGAWPLAGSAPAWEDGVPWSGSTSKSICRSESGKGRAAWYISGSGGQTPGSANSPPAAAAKASAAEEKVAKKAVAKERPAQAATGKSVKKRAVKKKQSGDRASATERS